MKIELNPIGVIHSCFKEKFGIPRQPGLAPSATATLQLLPPYNVEESLRGIEEFSHLWILFAFHASTCQQFKPTVRPPRLGGNTRIGVFACRSNFRPNPIGLSVVELKKVKGTTLQLTGGDFLDQTPVLDIKPYIPYADSIPSAHGAFADTAPAPVNTVFFNPAADRAIRTLENEQRPNLRKLLIDILSYNPRPAYQNNIPSRLFGTRIFDLEIKWKHDQDTVTVQSVNKT